MGAISGATFEALSRATEATLAPHGFALTRFERDGPFGSHYSEFTNGELAYRIVWDGKESWLLAEAKETQSFNWADLVLLRLGKFASNADAEAASAKVVDAIVSHLNASAA